MELSKPAHELQRESHAMAAPPAAISRRRGTMVSRSGATWKSDVKGIKEIATTTLVQSL